MVENAVLFDSHSRIPAYIQVASALRRRIEIGHWQVHEKISTLEELEAEFNLSRVTVSKAIELLEEEGLVTRQQGRGRLSQESCRISDGYNWRQPGHR